MAFIITTLEEITTVLKKRIHDDIPDYIKEIITENEKIIISAYGFKVTFTFESFKDGVISFKVSSSKFLKLLFNLLKGKISEDYYAITSSKLIYRISAHLKTIDKDIQINDIERRDKQFHINFKL